MSDTRQAVSLDGNLTTTILRLSWPAILEQFLLCLTTLADTAMVGSIGAAATAAVAINTSTIWLINGFITALSVGFSFLTARSIGAQDEKKVESIIRQSLSCSLLLGGLLTLCVAAVSPFLPVWLGAEPEVLPAARDYLFVIAFSLIPKTAATVLSAVFRAAGNTRIPLVTNLVANMLNIIGNFFLIYGTRTVFVSGNPAVIPGLGLGVKGAAIATTLSQWILAAVLLWFLYHYPSAARITPSGNYRLEKVLMYDMGRVSIPVLLERATLCLGQIALTAMISVLGTVSLAAHYLTNQTESLLYLPAYGFAYTATTLVGQALGARRSDLAEQYAKRICLIGSVAILIACVPVYLAAGPIIRIFTSDQEVTALAIVTLRIAAATELFFSFFVMTGGVFRGSGDVRFPLIVSLIGMWGLRVGLVYIAVSILSLGVIGVWLAIGLDVWIRAILCFVHLQRGKWKYAWNGA